MANFGSLGIGGALANALNTGIDFGNKFSNYQQNRYLESSDQINKLSANEASIFSNRADTIYNANAAAKLDAMMQLPSRNEVQSSQSLQGQRVQGNAEQQAINNAVIQNALNQGVYNTQSPQGLPQNDYLLGQTFQLNDYTQPQTPEQIGARFREQLQLNGGNPDLSLRGVINGY